MATARDIKSKIASIKNTQKITRAMQMVAASKMRKAQDRMAASRPYAEKMFQVISHLSGAHPEYRHPYLNVREIKRVGFIVVTTDRGLCGGLNANLLRATVQDMRAWDEKGVEQDLCLVGNKADAFFRRHGGHIVAKGNHINDKTGVKDLIGAVKVMLDSFDAGQIDALYIAYNEFINTMSQKPKIERLLPIVSSEGEGKKRYWDYIYEPGARTLLDKLLTRYIEVGVYQAAVENIACEQSSRMVAMMSATDNAAKLIDELNLDYNKVRQAIITREISEIVGGAQAIL